MPLSYAVRAPAGATDTPLASCYSRDFPAALQSLLAALADLETHHEIERARLEQEMVLADEKQRLIAELEADVNKWRELLRLRLAQVQSFSMAQASGE